MRPHAGPKSTPLSTDDADSAAGSANQSPYISVTSTRVENHDTRSVLRVQSLFEAIENNNKKK